jgi:hypothetical protein
MRVVGMIKKNSKDTIFISLGDYKDHAICDVRIYYQASDGKYLPTPRGLTFSVGLLPEILEPLKVASEKLEVSR